MNSTLLRRFLPLTFLMAACNGSPMTTDDVVTDHPIGVDTIDVAHDATNIDAVDTAVPDVGTCNPDGGITCSGDWASHCSPGCDPTECCSPQHGVFSCVPRDGSGQCPAADLFIDQARLASSPVVQWAYFAPNACEIMEGCVNAPGVRRLLRFDSRTPNQGTADMYLGSPAGNPNFEYSTCHMHYHFTTYASYTLANPDGTIAARGHKQAFCLEDYETNGATSPVHYNCGDQGIQMGWADTYWGALPCQWIDVTDVAPGNYNLHVEINTAHILNESNYANNSAQTSVTITASTPPAPDPRTPCTAAQSGLDRVCGWTFEAVHTCTPGEMLHVGCSAACSLGTCTGDTMMRIYDGDRTAPGSITFEDGLITQDDDSGCTSGDLCSRTQFTCPTSGQYSVLTGPYDSMTPATCNVAVGP